MKRVLLGLGVVLLFATTASATILNNLSLGEELNTAGPHNGQNYTGAGDPNWPATSGPADSYGDGGQFSFIVSNPTVTGNPVLGDFVSFCANITQFLHSPLYVVGLSGTTNSNGVALSDYGKWVYWKYMGGIDGSSVGPTPRLIGGVLDFHIGQSNAGDIQNQLWFGLYGTDGGKFSLNAAWAAQYATDLGNASLGHAWGNSVGVAWLSSSPNGVPNDQDQLVFGPGQYGGTPEPASLAIWTLIGGAALAGAAMKRRQRRWSAGNRRAIMSIVQQHT